MSTANAGAGRLSARVTCAGAAAPHSVRVRGGSRAELVWHPARAAPHRVTLLWSGAPVHRDPLLVDVAPPHKQQEVGIVLQCLNHSLHSGFLDLTSLVS